MTSSASTPGSSTTAKRSAATMRRMSGSCGASSSGSSAVRLALYSAYMARRGTSPPGASKTIATCEGRSSRNSFTHIVVKPSTAFVGMPFDVDRKGIAWKARKTYELPSTR